MTLPIACAQLACTPFDPVSNLDKAEHYVHDAWGRGARLILLPEFLTSGCTYDHRMHDFAEPIGGPTSRWMQRRSAQLRCWIGAGILERSEKRVYDTFLLAGPAGELLIYRKRHPFYFERLYFHCGKTLGVFESALGRIGMMMCWDMVQPALLEEMLGRIDLLLIVSAWPDVSRGNIPLYGIRDWLSRQPAERPAQLAQQLNVPVAYCNMTGPFVTRIPFLGLSYRTQYSGSSSIVDHTGKKLASTVDGETTLMAEVQVGNPRRMRAA